MRVGCEDAKSFMQIRFLGQFVKHELISQSEAEEIFHEKGGAEDDRGQSRNGSQRFFEFVQARNRAGARNQIAADAAERYDPRHFGLIQRRGQSLREPALILRGEMLRLAAHALRDSVRTPRPAGVASVEDRIRKLLSGAAASDLMSQPTCELARQCACSERHFRRLFKAEVGCPLRTWQIQGRIRKAARLLRESDAKVVDVALECGFEHLGQFNAAFKRLLGQTPSRWRQSFLRSSRPVVCPRPIETAGRAALGAWQDLRT